MEAELKAHMVKVGTRFSVATGLASSTVGMRVARDGRFFDRLTDGRGFTVKTYDNVLQWFSDHWPDNAEWPRDVPRPEPHRNGAAA
jgi:hypothetical protein